MKFDKKLMYKCCAVVAILIVAIIVACFAGINKDLMYNAHEEIDIVIGKDFEISDVKKITDEVFANKYVVLRKVEVFKDAVAIDVDYASEEECTNLKDKINELYGLELESVTAKQVPGINILDIVMPYIFPSLISIVILLVYTAIKYKSINKKAIYMEPICLLLTLISALVVFYSLIVISRIPFSKTIIALSVIYSFIVAIIWVYNEEKKLKKANEE